MTRNLQSALGAAFLMLGVLGLVTPNALPAVAAESAESEPLPRLTISSIEVTPDKPAADTLCRLKVILDNQDPRIASQLGFTITINGQELPVYRNHLFMFPVEPGGASELPLYNFWSTETSRPMPTSGKLDIEVTLREARWMKIETIEEVETWTPLGDVSELPVSRKITLKMTK